MAGNFASRAPLKRSACDRCRSQKLRCHRDEERSADACLRCMKSGVKCVTSMARPTGRPPSHQPPRIVQTDISSSSQTSNTSPDDGSSSGADINMVNLDYDMSLDNFLDSIGMRHSDPILSDDIDTSLFSQPTVRRGTSPAIVPPPQTQGGLGSSQPAPYQFNGIPVPRAGPTDPELPMRTDRVEVLLSNLHSELCSQLFSIRSIPWNVKGTLSLTFSHKSNGQELEISDSHPLVQVSKVSTELERLLASLRPSGIVEHTPSTVSYTPAPPSLRTSQLLVAFSCYIQIVSIYDIIISKVIDYLASGPMVSTAAALQPSAPTLYLGGLPIPPNQRLSGSLLVHLIEHQLQRIELLMGLPEHYRISSGSKDSMDGAIGLFGGQHSQSLLNAVIQLGEDRDGNHDDTRCVRSLKLKMRQIKDL